MATIVALKGWNSSLTAWNSGTWNGEGAFPGATGVIGSVAITGEGEVGVFGVAGTTQIQRYEHVLKRDHTSYPKSISKARQREKLRVTTQRYGLGNPDEPAKRQVNGDYVVNQQ